MMHVLVMGVSGSGKSTLGAALADRLGARFIDADDLHPAENIARMEAGLPLTDALRLPWLSACGAEMRRLEGDVVLACSALKRAYRDHLRAAVPDLRVVYPDASRDLIERRMRARQGHFMPASLLDSQFEALEPPAAAENAIAVDIDATVPVIVEAMMAGLLAGN